MVELVFVNDWWSLCPRGCAKQNDVVLAEDRRLLCIATLTDIVTFYATMYPSSVTGGNL